MQVDEYDVHDTRLQDGVQDVSQARELEAFNTTSPRTLGYAVPIACLQPRLSTCMCALKLSNNSTQEPLQLARRL